MNSSDRIIFVQVIASYLCRGVITVPVTDPMNKVVAGLSPDTHALESFVRRIEVINFRPSKKYFERITQIQSDKE